MKALKQKLCQLQNLINKGCKTPVRKRTAMVTVVVILIVVSEPKKGTKRPDG